MAAVSVALQAACSSRPAGGDEPLRPAQAGVRTQGGLEYRGQLLVMESFPVQLAATVTVTNTSDAERTVTFPDACVVLMRAYQVDREVWDQASVAMCAQALEEVTLPAGGSRSFRAGTTAYEILGDALPDGSYRMTAYLRPEGGAVELELGNADLGIPRS